MEEDRLLVAAAARGEPEAVRRLYEHNSARIFGAVRRLAGDDSLAEDWAQEAWMRVFRSLRSYRGDSRFSTWAHRIAVNVALNARRRLGREAQRKRSLDAVPEPVGRPDRPLLRMRLEEAIDQLPDGMRKVLVLHDVEGFTHAEIAEMTGVAVGTCKSQLFKARAKLRDLLGPAVTSTEGERICT